MGPLGDPKLPGGAVHTETNNNPVQHDKMLEYRCKYGACWSTGKAATSSPFWNQSVSKNKHQNQIVKAQVEGICQMEQREMHSWQREQNTQIHKVLWC